MTNPLTLYTGSVEAEWVDANGHMNDGYYAVVFGAASWKVQDHLGMDGTYRADTCCTLYTVEAHIVYLRELLEGQSIRVESMLLGVDAKRIRLFHRMFATEEGYLAATMELMLLHYDQRAGRTTPFPETPAARLRTLAHAHTGLTWPQEAGRCVRAVRE